MSRDWDYAKLTHDVAKAGGVDIWVEKIKNVAYEQGSSDTKNKITLPLLVVGATIGAISLYAYQKLIENRINKNALNNEAEKAEVFLKEELTLQIDETNETMLGENNNEEF